MKNTRQSPKSEKPSKTKADRALLDEDIGEGLTDDERTKREDQSAGEGGRVDLGPADLDRLPKK